MVVEEGRVAMPRDVRAARRRVFRPCMGVEGRMERRTVDLWCLRRRVMWEGVRGAVRGSEDMLRSVEEVRR